MPYIIKTYNYPKYTVFFLGVFIFVGLFFSCGITEYYYLEPPQENLPATGLSSPDSATNQYDFYIPNIDTNGILLGYVIYYKFYNSVGVANNDIASIKNANILYSSQGMDRAKSLGYRQMFFKAPGDDRYTDRFGGAGGLQNVQIRLINQGTYTIGVNVGTVTHQYDPFRYNNTDFQIFDTNGSYANFQTSDLDVSFSAGSGNDTWYVNAYAAAFGQTPQFSPVYSQLVHLGAIRIIKP